ncbi:patched sphingolipid transporter [Lineolata rhizophorae]|uniref:Patched sphingolipid transporter n=1 Tax=Lineolata rhizophorae TaxID=578093 RepID=A0A6A6NQN6_9PEZI|nr:patched sphingolipid transporter [Lineolata rhizophorae]
MRVGVIAPWRLAPLLVPALVSGLTEIHKAGRCAIRGHCGSESFFGPQLPCPDNGLAEQPSAATRERLLGLCGERWADGAVCCVDEQLDALESNLKRADPMIAACPACKENFFNLFCSFTCSPDQSLFVNVTNTKEKSGKLLVTELDHLVSDAYGEGFYDSCKDVKFGATNGRAMDLIGGSAKTYTEFLKFLGDKKFLGSPFQMDFPRPNRTEFPGMEPLGYKAKACDDPDPAYRCACVDCPGSCPELHEVTEAKSCYVGVLPCLSFSVILIYSVFILLLVLAVSGHVAYQTHAKHKNERLRLLQDVDPSDDEDEGDIVHGAGLLDTPQRHYPPNTVVDAAFNRLGRICATFPAVTISVSIVVVVLLSLGWLRFEVERDPVRLWVAPNSDAAQEKAFFDENFGPFYRAEQAFLVNDTGSKPGPVLSYETLAWWFDVEDRVRRMLGHNGTTRLQDVCYKPTGDACVVQSISAYYGGGFAGVDPNKWREQLKDCAENPAGEGCIPDFGLPLDPKMVLGGWQEGGNVLDANALIVTWVVENHAEGTRELERAEEWEESLTRLMTDIQWEAKKHGLRLSFNTEISLEQELNKSTNTDAKIVVISYIVMFLYASLALGSTTLSARSILSHPATALVQSKFSLGVVGILIVLMSVAASVGLFSAAGVKVTLIIAEVIPFLVLAIGVDNIFILTHEFERANLSHPDEGVEDRVARALGRMGPSILFSATTETVAFALGAAVGMPAVRNFAAYAAGAVLINAILQVTMFISVLALNQRRVEAYRADCFPCIRVRRAEADSFAAANGSGGPGLGYGLEEEGSLQRFIRKVYAPAILGNRAKFAIITVFLGILTAGLALLPKVELGLDQRIAIPSDSYLIDFFNDLYDYFGAGPPVYFIAKDIDVTERLGQQALCGRFSTCEEFSLANILEQERKRPEVSYIADATASWVDDYFMWLNPNFEQCCVDGERESPSSTPCFADRDPPWNITLSGMPEDGEFMTYLARWLEAPTDELCPLGGKAPYSTAVVTDDNNTAVLTSHFRTAHTPLRSQDDFISAYASARRIASDISDSTSSTVFPYSKFYIFFDQYTTIVRLAFTLLGSGLAMVLVVSTFLLGSVRTAIAVTITVACTLVAVAGTMALAHVSLNAVSLVNLVISLGIAVEFCAHVARAFSFPSARREARAWAALVNVGGSVVSGILITKALGVCVLAFTRSKIFEVYYFRVWVALVCWAAVHSLVLLPVLLAVMGGRGYVDPESEGGLEQDLRSRRYPALLDDDYDSDDM